jgi:hypothetical protein
VDFWDGEASTKLSWTKLGITSAVAWSVPTPNVIFGLLGGIPYLLASGTTIYLAHQAGLATSGIYNPNYC